MASIYWRKREHLIKQRGEPDKREIKEPDKKVIYLKPDGTKQNK